MSPRRVAVLGGGPAGLFSARLIALDHPDWDVTLYERLPPGETFGFGVGLTSALMDAVAEADPEVNADIVAAARAFAGAEFRLPSGAARLDRWHSGAIGRAHLLEILTARAVEAGVVMRRASADVDTLRASYDLVIAADGVSSATRARFSAELGATESLGRGVFIWCGSRTRLEGTIFEPVETPDGTFVAHAYPYADDASTFVIETDEDALRGAGCVTTEFATDGASDETTLAYLSSAFSGLLNGGEFLGNRSRWMHFRTVKCERWVVGNVVLLGDARATVHPSLGSGTKVAMEDAIALRDALSDEAGDQAVQLATFERLRRPSVERLQERALRSRLWWESFPTRLDLSPARVAVAYLSRAGAVSVDDLLDSAPVLARQAVADWAGADLAEVPQSGLREWIMSRALDHPAPDGAHVLTVEACPDPWGPDADLLVSQAQAVPSGQAIELRGESTRSALLDRLALGERLRTQLGLTVTVRADASGRGDVADGLVSGRTDYVRLEA